jgi:hypothetical protein
MGGKPAMLRKSLITPSSERSSGADPLSAIDAPWLDLGDVAQIEISSEDPKYPVEGALVTGGERGWRAAHAGPQTIRILFDHPMRLRRTSLLFIEPDLTRTQEFVIRWSADGGASFRDLVRQQWNFSPTGSAREAEDYRVDLSDVTRLELTIVPDVSGGDAHASLAHWRLA